MTCAGGCVGPAGPREDTTPPYTSQLERIARLRGDISSKVDPASGFNPPTRPWKCDVTRSDQDRPTHRWREEAPGAEAPQGKELHRVPPRSWPKDAKTNGAPA